MELIFAYIAIFLLFGVIVFQIMLISGMPLGEYAMGGKYPGKFPLRIRIAAIFQSIILLFFAFIVLVRAEIIFIQYLEFSKIGIWFVFAFSVIASVLNIITPSKKERKVWAPVSVILLICTFMIAIL
mgnify:CR=1 FL=1